MEEGIVIRPEQAARRCLEELNSMTGQDTNSPDNIESVVNAIRAEVAKSVVGYEEQVEDFLICLLSHGHMLVEGVPGISKTTISKTFASVCDLTYRRIQFTQDLLPADITGHYFFNQRTGEFEVRKGPVFAGFVLADEINRAPPKTQSALLEAMQESQVTIEGNSFDLPDPLIVVATLNPIETEGVYPLPEAQIDRFTLKSTMDYLDSEQEIDILRMKMAESPSPNIVLTKEAILDMRKEVMGVHSHRSIMEYVRNIATASRSAEDLDLGLSPRGAIHLFAAARSHAYLHGRGYVIPDDVKAMAHKAMDHRLIMSPESELSGTTKASITESILSEIPVPKGEFARDDGFEE
jgi:MoxR-like ATPase